MSGGKSTDRREQFSGLTGPGETAIRTGTDAAEANPEKQDIFEFVATKFA